MYLSLCEFLFADDAAFVTLSNNVLQKILNIADEILSAFGRSISVTKTEIMVIQPRSEEKQDSLPIFVRGQLYYKTHIFLLNISAARFPCPSL